MTQKLSRDEIRDFFRAEGAVRFDLSPCARFRYPADFDRQKYAAWLKMSGISGRPRTEDVLVNIEAAERSGGKLIFRNAGVLFFAKNVRHFFQQAYITCLLARGTDKVHILDRKDFDGGIVADIEDALRFIERNTRVAYRIERLRRQEIPEYPLAALREAITNAVMHRDWFNEGANVFVEIYSDRVEVSNPGGLPKGMLPSDLGHKSVRRNPLIADLLHRIEFIEKAGTGIKRMREEARKYGSPEPKFDTTGFFTATFYPSPEVRRQALAATGEVTGEIGNQVGTKSAPSRHQVTPEVAPEVTPEVFRLLSVLKGPMDRQSLQKILGLKAEKNFRLVYLRPAMKLCLIEMTNPHKPRSSRQRYRITAEGNKMLQKLSRPRKKD